MNALFIPRTFAYAFWPLGDFSDHCEGYLRLIYWMTGGESTQLRWMH